MRKLLRSRKALSPVIAAIILIAVTVAVSIAVAAWMGALTFTFMGTEQISFTGITWDITNKNCTLTVKNTGTATLTIASVKVNNDVLNSTSWAASPATLSANQVATLYIHYDTFANGDVFAFIVTTSKNNPFGPYTVTAPG
mgnify:CR=1 FL=1